MKGTLANGAAIVLGGGLGVLLRGRFEERYKSILVQGVGLCVCLVGLQMALSSKDVILLLGSMAAGGVLGEWIGVEAALERLGNRLKGWARSERADFVEGFVTASLVFCVGSMAVVGAVEDGLRGNASILYAKAAIDGVFAMAAAASMGPGVAFSALPVVLYQGALTLGASRLGAVMTPAVVEAMASTGGLLIAAIGLNILGVARIRVGNLLPALFLAALLRGLL